MLLLDLEHSGKLCETAVLCVWFQSYIRRASVSFPGTRATKEAPSILSRAQAHEVPG